MYVLFYLLCESDIDFLFVFFYFRYEWNKEIHRSPIEVSAQKVSYVVYV